MLSLRTCFGLFITFALYCIPTAGAQENAEPELKIDIRQSQFHDDFTQRELHVYRIEGRRLTIVIEAFDDPEAEASLNHLMDESRLNQLKNIIERNRLMETEIGCEVISRDTRTKLKTEVRVAYKGKEITCYSFDQPFSRQLEDLLKGINRIIPGDQYELAIPSYNPRIEVGR